MKQGLSTNQMPEDYYIMIWKLFQINLFQWLNVTQPHCFKNVNIGLEAMIALQFVKIQEELLNLGSIQLSYFVNQN